MFDLGGVHPEVRELFDDELLRAVRADVRGEVRGGYRDAAAIVDEVYSSWEPVVDHALAEEPLRLLIADGVSAEWAALEAERAGWPPETDCDRLDRAFAALDGSGVVVMPYADPDEVWTGRTDPPNGSQATRGKVSFDPHAVSEATRTGRLELTFYASRRGDQRALGAEIVQALRDQGLDATWDPGKQDRRAHIVTVSLQWRRRPNWAR